MTVFYAFVVAFISSVMLIPPLTRLAYQRQIIDQPGERKVHEVSLPRIGGLAIFLSFLFSSFIFMEIDATLRGIYIGMFIILGVGLMDDLQGLTPYWKLAGQFVAAGFPVFFSHIRIESLGFQGLTAISPWLLSAFTLLVIVAITNAINLSDGLDGLAGGITLICLVAMGALAYRLFGYQENASYVILLMALAGALLGFLKYNTYPATIFMGDTGSLFLGFASVTISLWLIQRSHGSLGPAHALLVFAIPVIDTLWVMGNRVVRGISPFTADRNHLHHRLMDMGFTHKGVVTIIYALTTFTAMLPVIFAKAPAPVLYGMFMVVAVTVITLVHLFGGSVMRRRQKTLGRALIREATSAGSSFLRRVATLSVYAHFLMKYLIMAIFVIPVFFLPSIPVEFGIVMIGFALLLVFLLLTDRNWVDDFLQFSIYFTSAAILLVYNFYPLQFSQGGTVFYLQPVYNGLFVLLVVLIAFEIFVVRRTEVLLSTPLEFFILVIALAVPFLPENLTGSYKLGAVGIKSIALFLGYKVLFLKNIKKNRRTIVVLIASSAVIGIRALGGW